jgi:hypothetical protein
MINREDNMSKKEQKANPKKPNEKVVGTAADSFIITDKTSKKEILNKRG